MKPWGTCHAVLAARKEVDGPFAVINSDDYYGPEAFREIYRYLEEHPDKPGCYEFAMVGYLLGNTVTEHGHVARGCARRMRSTICSVSQSTPTSRRPGRTPAPRWMAGRPGPVCRGDTVVSMNLWGFTPAFFGRRRRASPRFWTRYWQRTPRRGEYFLPSVVTQLLEEKRARVKVLRSTDKWYGVTYREDKPQVVAAIAAMTQSGLYPERLWDI